MREYSYRIQFPYYNPIHMAYFAAQSHKIVDIFLFIHVDVDYLLL